MYRTLIGWCVFAVVAGLSGCHREHFRRRADRAGGALIVEKIAQPNWHIDNNCAWPDPRSRFADPTPKDRPPKPTDDPTAAWLSIDPQPKHCCAEPFEGTEYLHLMPLVEVEYEEPGRYRLDPFIEPGQPARLIGLQNAHQVALLNSREFQNRRESLFFAALELSLERNAFAPQFFATGQWMFERVGRLFDDNDPTTPGTTALSITPGELEGNVIVPGESLGSGIFDDQTVDNFAGRGPLSGSGFGFTKLFVTGGALLLQFANETVFELAGPFEGTFSQSNATLQLIQPLLQGGGRAVTLEPLTQTERNLLYEIRSYVRFQREFFANIASGSSLTQFDRLDAFEGFADIGVLTLLEELQIVRNEERNLEFLEKVARGFEAIERDAEDDLQFAQIQSEVAIARTNVVDARQIYFEDLDRFKLQLGVPMDLPLVLDADVLRQFDLNVVGCELPDLPESLAKLGITIREIEQVAVNNRLDLKNQRALLVDRWRKIRVAANALTGILDVEYEGSWLTPDPDDTSQPLNFGSSRGRHRVKLNGELPLVRIEERNVYRATLIEYQRGRRELMLAEDAVRLEVRIDLRSYNAARQNFEIQRAAVLLACRRVERTAQLLAQQKEAARQDELDTTDEEEDEEEDDEEEDDELDDIVDALDLIFAQADLLETQNVLAGAWANYHAARIALMRDMGTLDPLNTPLSVILDEVIPGLPQIIQGKLVDERVMYLPGPQIAAPDEKSLFAVTSDEVIPVAASDQPRESDDEGVIDLLGPQIAAPAENSLFSATMDQVIPVAASDQPRESDDGSVIDLPGPQIAAPAEKSLFAVTSDEVIPVAASDQPRESDDGSVIDLPGPQIAAPAEKSLLERLLKSQVAKPNPVTLDDGSSSE